MRFLAFSFHFFFFIRCSRVYVRLYVYLFCCFLHNSVPVRSIVLGYSNTITIFVPYAIVPFANYFLFYCHWFQMCLSFYSTFAFYNLQKDLLIFSVEKSSLQRCRCLCVWHAGTRKCRDCIKYCEKKKRRRADSRAEENCVRTACSSQQQQQQQQIPFWPYAPIWVRQFIYVSPYSARTTNRMANKSLVLFACGQVAQSYESCPCVPMEKKKIGADTENVAHIADAHWQWERSERKNKLFIRRICIELNVDEYIRRSSVHIMLVWSYIPMGISTENLQCNSFDK